MAARAPHDIELGFDMDNIQQSSLLVDALPTVAMIVILMLLHEQQQRCNKGNSNDITDDSPRGHHRAYGRACGVPQKDGVFRAGQ
jgi:hypothetical protein